MFYHDIPGSFDEQAYSNVELIYSQRSPSVSQKGTPVPHSDGAPSSRKQDTLHPRRKKTIFDRVYGEMVFPPVLSLFINSPVVQRLRGLKQLGNTDYVYPGATHTRFEHSLGVAHLAMEFLRQIWTNHHMPGGFSAFPLPPREEFDRLKREKGLSGAEAREWVEKEYEKDVWCMGIAGLCHDLGHGPLSHMFESFVNSVRERTAGRGLAEDEKFHHDRMSLSLLDTIWEKNKRKLEEYELGPCDLYFIQLLIKGLSPAEPFDQRATGRPAWKRFMTDIVANKRNGLDVDKLDYLQRDSLTTQGTLALPSLKRLFQAACAASDANGEWQICYQEKVDGTMEEVFLARARLHSVVYQHRVTRVMDQMTCDAFLAAETSFTIHVRGKEYRLSNIVDDPEAYLETGDWIVDAILHSPTEGMQYAQEILKRIRSRRIYQTIGFFTSYTAAKREEKITGGEETLEDLRRKGSSTPVRGSGRTGRGNITVEEICYRLQSNHAAFYQAIRKWEEEMENKLGYPYPALVLLKSEISRTPTDIKGGNPLDLTLYFNSRYTDGVPFPRKTKSTTSGGVRPYYRVYFVTRRPCNSIEKEILGEVFQELTKDNDITSVVDHVATPHSQRGRSALRIEPLSQRDGEEDEVVVQPPPTILTNRFSVMPGNNNNNINNSNVTTFNSTEETLFISPVESQKKRRRE